MSEFDGALAIGSVTGYRAWKVETTGQLRALAYPTNWGSGEFVAECLGQPDEDQMENRPGEDYYTRLDRIRLWRRSHNMAECRHGFYAYYTVDRASSWAASHPHVTGVIKGYGETLIGTQGFRSMKAEILALCFAPANGMWRLEPEFQRKIRERYNVPIFDNPARMAAEFPATDPREYRGTDDPMFKGGRIPWSDDPWHFGQK